LGEDIDNRWDKWKITPLSQDERFWKTRDYFTKVIVLGFAVTPDLIGLKSVDTKLNDKINVAKKE
jgi:hypothetical protein